MKIEKVKGWDKRWKPQEAINSKDSRKEISLPFYDGKNIYATDGKIMAVYPVGKVSLKKGPLGKLPKGKKPPTVEEETHIPKDKDTRYCVSFNPKLLLRVWKAIGSPMIGSGATSCPSLKLYYNLDDPLKPILVEGSGKAYGVLMPTRQM